MNKIEKIQEFIQTCPYLKNDRINVDYLDGKLYSYSLQVTGNETRLDKYVDGTGGRKQLTFDFVVNMPMGARLLENLTNSQFGEDFCNWINTQNRLRNLPNIDGAFSIEAISPANVYQRTQTEAIYIIPMNFIYYELS